MWDMEDHTSFKYRLARRLINSLLSIVQSLYYQDSFFAPELLFSRKAAYEVLIVAHGAPGFRDQLQMASNLVVINPLTKL